ncbi:conserved hypothetical protein [Theileria equi strain WA]|uniref:Uncharacterized protein n=1 Tax=Theileria equi strain WA TaxID=1537102 RepID=L1LF88_THEEQ|nr:conserved hypothetical protein [Theileria equi strain WA]EKX74021.1 conserved hypothetical protein [Theileria equi strain WA]|eukprot:XP_004833473.1 conserved hypothetical protein [Theileria equi strain WA]
MVDNRQSYIEALGNLKLYPFSDRETLSVLESLESTCNIVNKKDSHFFSGILDKLENKSENKYRNCLESLLSSNFIAQREAGTNDLESVLQSRIHRGTGIAQITGPSGSGKTFICMLLANKLQGNVIYLDTHGSFDPKKVLTFDSKTSSFIPLRLYNCEEILVFLEEFETRLSRDDVLSRNCGIRAQSVDMLIIDSLWCIDQIPKFHLRHRFLVDISVILRRISWTFNISVVVCSNEYKAHKNKRINKIFNKWNANCYVHIHLKQKLLNYQTTIQDTLENKISSHVYRVMSINPESLIYSKGIRFSINRQEDLSQTQNYSQDGPIYPGLQF